MMRKVMLIGLATAIALGPIAAESVLARKGSGVNQTRSRVQRPLAPKRNKPAPSVPPGNADNPQPGNSPVMPPANPNPNQDFNPHGPYVGLKWVPDV